VGAELANHLIRIGAAHVVALQKHLRASTRTHDLAAQILETGFLIVCPHEQHQSAGKQKRFQEFFHLPAPAGCMPRSSICATATVLRTGTLTGAALGTSAMPVPNTITSTPIQIQFTS